MTDSGKREGQAVAGQQAAPSQEDVGDSGEIPSRRTPRREFPIVQYGFTIPKPSYHEHLGDEAASQYKLDEVSPPEAERSKPVSGSDLTEDVVAASRKIRSRKMRLWAFFALVILIYGLLRTAQYMR